MSCFGFVVNTDEYPDLIMVIVEAIDILFIEGQYNYRGFICSQNITFVIPVSYFLCFFF